MAPRGGGRPAGKAKIGWAWHRVPSTPKVPPVPELSHHRVPLTGEARLPHQLLLGENLHCLQRRKLMGWEKNTLEAVGKPSPIPSIRSRQQHYSHSRCCRPRCRPASPPHRSPREGHVGDQPKNTPAPDQAPLHTPGNAGGQRGARCPGLAKKRLRYPISLERGKNNPNLKNKSTGITLRSQWRCHGEGLTSQLMSD